MSLGSSAAIILSATETSPPCKIFTLSAQIKGNGSISTTPEDMDIQINGSGSGGIHQCELEVRNGPPRYTTPIALEFEWKDIPAWTPNGIIRPPSGTSLSIGTKSSPLFYASLKKTAGGQLGIQSITVYFRHGILNPVCPHQVDLAVQVI